jgi:uncharacterized lipoprotein
VNRIVSVRSAVSLLFAASLLGGCSWFHHRSDYYSKAAETRPLEVPPDLDTPVTSNELVVPQAGSAASGASVSAAPPAGGAVVSSTTDSSSGLRVADSPEHTWQRVGLALERAQVGTITRDENARSYTIGIAGLADTAPVQPQEHHWYSRILHPFGGGSKSSSTVSGDVTVRVSADGSGARVDVEGSPEAARRVLAVLRDRLS